MAEISVLEFDDTGSEEMSLFHTFDEGKIGQEPSGGGVGAAVGRGVGVCVGVGVGVAVGAGVDERPGVGVGVRPAVGVATGAGVGVIPAGTGVAGATSDVPVAVGSAEGVAPEGVAGGLSEGAPDTAAASKRVGDGNVFETPRGASQTNATPKTSTQTSAIAMTRPTGDLVTARVRNGIRRRSTGAS